MARRKSVAEILDERDAKRAQGDWYPASGGTEKPFKTRTGRRLQYVHQPSTGNSAYLDLDTDIVLSHREAKMALGLDGVHTQVPWAEAAIAVGVGLVIFALVRTANPASA